MNTNDLYFEYLKQDPNFSLTAAGIAAMLEISIEEAAELRMRRIDDTVEGEL